MSLYAQLQYPARAHKEPYVSSEYDRSICASGNTIMKERQKKKVGGEVGDGTEGRGGRKTGKEEVHKPSPRADTLSALLPTI